MKTVSSLPRFVHLKAFVSKSAIFPLFFALNRTYYSLIIALFDTNRKNPIFSFLPAFFFNNSVL